MPAATTQRKLVLDDQPTLVLAGIDTARLYLAGHDEDDVLCLIEEGFIAHAWNIALSNSDETRREIRIWPDCITWYSRTQGKGQYPKTEAQVFDQLFAHRQSELPAAQRHITSTRLRLILNCSSTHIISLIESKQLSVLPGTSWSTGPNGAALVTLNSITAFLKSRRLA